MNDNLKNLWNALKKSGYTPPDFDTFAKDMQDEGNLKRVHETLKREGYTPPQLETSKADIGHKVAAPAAVAPAVTQKVTPIQPVAQPGQGTTASKPISMPKPKPGDYEVMQSNVAAADTMPIDSLKPLGSGKGYQTRHQPTADELQRQKNEKVTREQVAQMSDDINARILKRGNELDDNADNSFFGNMMRGGGIGATPSYVTTNNKRKTDPEYKALEAAALAINDSKALIAEADKAQKEGNFDGFIKGAGRGFGNKLFDVRTWDSGLTEGVAAGTILTALQKADKGEALTDAEKTLLDAKAVELATNAYFGSYVGRGYKAGQVTAESIPFMIEMCINPASKAGTSAENMLTRYALKRFGKKAALEAFEKGGEGATKQAFKALGKKEAAKIIAGRVAGDIAGATTMTATTGLNRVVGDTFSRASGDIQFKTDEETGKSAYDGHTEGDSLGTAFAKAFAGTTIENYSEMFGEYFDPLKAVAGKAVRKGLNKIHLGGVNDFIDNIAASDVAKVISDFEENAHWSGSFSEYAEEVAGSIMNALIVGDQTFDTDENTGIFNLDNNIDTFLGVALMGGFMSMAKTAGYRTPKYNARKAMEKADNNGASLFANQDLWGQYRNTIAFGNDEEVKGAIANALANEDLTQEQKQAVLDYAKNVETYKGMQKGEQSKRSEQAGTPEVDAEQSYENGYTLEDAEEKQDASMMYENMRQKVTDALGEDLLGMLDENPLQALREIAARPDMNDDSKQLALDYVNAKATYDGMIDKVRDDIEGQVEASDKEIDARTNKQSGNIVSVKLKNDKEAYVVDGVIAMTDDGTAVDIQNSSESILIRDKETGKIEFTSPSNILSADAPIDANEEKQKAADAIRDAVAQQASDEIDGTLAFQPNDQYNLLDGNGNPITATIVQDNGDGTVMASFNGSEAQPVAKETIQQFADNAKQARLAQFEAEKQAQQQAETPEPVNGYGLNDEFMLNIDGKLVRGSIEQMPDEEGKFGVWTEDAVNGSKYHKFTADELDVMTGKVEAPVQEAAPIAEGDAPAQAEQAQEAMPMNADETDYDYATAGTQRTSQFLSNEEESGLTSDEADDFIADKIKEAEKALNKANSKKSKNTNLLQRKRENEAIKGEIDAAQSNLDFWNNVKNERENIKNAPAVGEESAENASAPVVSSAPEVGKPVAPVSVKAEEKETGKAEKEAKEPVEAPKANAPQAPTEESKVDKAKRLLDEMDEAEKMDNDEEANRIYGEYGKLVKELTDDEVEEIGNYIDEKNYEEEAFVADRLEGIYARRAQAHAAEIKQQMEEQQKKLVPLFKKLLAAMKGNFKKDIAAAKKEIEAELRNCNHMHLQIIMTHADATRKANKGKAEGKTATEIGKIAKMVVSDLYKQLGEALDKVNPDVRIDYSNGGFWLSGAKGTTLYDAFEAGGNSDRWIHEYNEQYAGAANTLDPLSPDNIADWVKHIKGVIEEYVSDYEKEQGKKDAIQKRLDAGNADAVRPADGWSDTELNLVKDEDARRFSTVEEDAPYSDASIIKLIKDRINDAITSETDEASVAEAKEALDWLESRGEDVTELRNQYNQKYGIKETNNYGLEQSEETGKPDNETQKMLDTIGRALNITIKVERRGEDFNGEWDPNTRTITINADKVTNSPETTLETIFGHELTHVIKEASADVPELWNAYVKFVKAVVGEEKYNNVFSEYQEHYTGLFKEGKLDTMPTDADIDEEVCAQFGGVAFVNAKQEAIQELVDTAIEESGKGTFIVKKVLESINNALRKLEAFLKGKKDPKYRVVQENLANARDTWGAMLVYAIEKEQKKNRDLNTATSGAGLIEGGNNVRKGVKLSVSSNIEGAGFETSYIGENDVKQALTNERGDMVIKMGDKEFDAQHPVTVEDIKSNKNSILSYMMKDAIGLGAITDAQAEKIYNKYVALINHYLSEGSVEKGGPSNVTDKWQWLGESIFRSVATNGDSQYKYSIDITRICKKNEAIINSISEMQRQLRYGITPAQILDLYLQTVEADYQAPCPVCYVFSRYIRNGKYASAAINGMRKYGKHLPGQAEEWTVDQWVAELERLEAEKKELGSYISKANTDVTTIPGKIDDLGKIITDQSTSEEEHNKLMQEVYALDKRYRKALDVVSQQSLTNWIKTFAIQSKDSKYIMREDAKMPEDMTDFEDHALDLRLTASAMVKYPAIQRLRKSGGAAAGKEITQASNNELGSISQALGTGSPEASVNWYQEAVNAKTAKERRKALKNARDRFKKALLYAKRQTLRGGQRMWSWSDNIERLSNDVAINLIQEEMLSGAVQSYSKQLEGIKLVASMGAYVNGSLMGKGLGYREVNAEDIEEVDGQKVVKGGSFSFDITNKKGETKTITLQAPVYEQNGKFYTLEFDPVVGIDAFGGIGEDGEKKKGLFQLNATLDKAGNILVGMNDIHCKAAMADNRVFFIIPWHASGMSSHVLTQMINFLGTEFDAKLAIDYTEMQEEKDYFKKSEGEYPEIPSRMVAIWEEVKNETDWKSGIGAIPSGNGQGKLSEAQKRYRRLRDAILKGVEITVTDKKGNPKTQYVPVEMYDNMMKQIKADEFLKQVYAKTRAVVGKESMTKEDCDHIYPYEYWDESSTFETAGINGKRYLEYCRRLGFKPKFCGRFKAAEGSEAANQGNFIHEEGYWKTLIDRRMYDTEGKFQDLTVVDSEGFDPTMIDPEETKKEFVVTKVADEEGVKRIVDATKQMEIERSGDIADVNYDLTMREAVDRYNDNEAEATKGKKLSALDDSGLADIIDNIEDDAAEEENGLRFSLLEEDNAETEADKKALDDIKNGNTTTVYRGMQVVEIDGKRYALPPMASKIDGKWVMGVLINDDGTLEPQLLKADEHPELAKDGKFYLDKGNDKGLWAAYNPYWHTSTTMLNDQFSEAQSRPNLITVEGVVPNSDIKSGYKAEGAKDDVGEHLWKAGVIQGQMTGKRKVILSRYFQGIRVVPDAEVAQNIFNDIKDNVEYMPTNVVPPGVRAELEKLGVKFIETNNKNQLVNGEHAGDQFTWWYGNKADKNRRDAFRDRAVAEYMHLSDWLKKEGREGQLDPQVVEKADKNIDKSIELQKAKDAEKANKTSKKSDTRERQAAPSVTYTKDTSRNYSRKKQAEYAQRQERRARQKIDDFCKKLHIDGIVTLLDDGSGLKGKKARAKGWFDVRTGKITIVLGNHSSLGDVMKTILHESVAHYGLRKLFGKNFDTFLDNTFQNADEDIRRQIVELAKKHKWNFRVATEEYLAKLAEDTEFDTAEHQEWWDKVKFFFYDMMKKLGIDGFKSNIIITDNELKYLLWRSYNGLTAPTRFKSYVGMAEDVVMQNELGVGNYEENTGNGEWSAAEDTLFRDADDTDAEEPKTMSEQILEGLMQLSQRNADNVQLKLDILKSISAQISKLKKAARAQREYDKTTVDEMVGIARIMLANGYIDTMTAPEVKRLLLDIRNATGKEDITKYAREMIKHLTDIQVKQAMKVFGSVIKIRGSKVNASGVEVQGTLDVKGQMFINAFRGAFGLSEQAIQDRIDDLTDKMADPNQMIAENAAIERGALTLALSYVQDVKMSLEEEKQLKQELKDAKEAKKAGTMDKDAYKQFVEATENALLQNKLERIEALRQLTGKLAGALRGSIQDAKEFREQEKQRVRNIQHYANSDMEGRPTDEHHKEDWKQKFMNNSFIRFFLKPLGTFDQMLRMFGNKNVNGEGYLYNHFMRKWLNASHNEFKKFKAATDVLDKKVSEVFGKKMRWSDLYALERKMGTVTVEFYDGGVKKSHELTQGNLLYMWMVNKMDDGAMKLAKMGITEADMKAVENMLDPRFKELANWIQEEFLVNKRNEYNEVHERLFGAPMANIDNYFPLKVLANARTENIEIADNNGSNALVSTVTGSVIKRRRNSLALDITGADAFSVVIEHIQQMEHWAAYAEFNKDINTLLSYKHFRNQVMNMSSVYGGGKKLWDNFKDVCKIASGVYRPISTSDSADKTFLNAAKGITAAKISFRIFTALKQFLSSPAYLAEANVINIGKSLATPWLSWNWAMQELPTFQKRWQSRQAGDSRLMDTDMDWRFWHNRMVETISRWGMSPNAFVDAMTVSIGAKAIYDTKLAQYLKDGYSQTKAEQKAKEDAAVLVNETQQSSEAAFMSTIQLDRTVASVALTVFRNSSMGYQRQFVDAIRSLKKMMTPGNRAKSIEFMTKQMVRDGLDDAQAKRAATRVYNHAAFRHLARVAVFGYIMQFAWNLGPYMAYLLMGDDDDEKDKMLEDAAQHALFGGLEGLSAGSILSEIANMMASGASFRNYEFNLLPMMADIQSIVTHFENDKVAGSNEIINLLLQSAIGMNPQTATDAAVAIYDACKGDPKTSKEATILIMRLLSMPKGQIEKIYIDELGLKGNEVKNYTVAQMAERYARYKKNAGAPLTQVFYSDPVEEAVVGKYIEKFEKKVKERVKASTGNKELDDAYQKYEEKFKEADKTYQSIMDLRTKDQSEFIRRMQDFSTTEEFRDYSLFKGYKNAIDNLFKTALNIQDPQKRDELLRQADEYKGKLVTELDKLHQ